MRWLISAVLMWMLAAPAWAGMKEGAAAYKRGDYRAAFGEYLPLAMMGNAKAQVPVARMYALGQGVTRDFATALTWYRMAAKKNDAEAQFNLGVMYGAGRGVRQDFAAAVKWFRLAAKQGSGVAQLNLAVIYGNGQGVPQDYVRGLVWSVLASVYLPPGKQRDTAIKNRNVLRKALTPAQLAEAQRMVNELKPKK